MTGVNLRYICAECNKDYSRAEFVALDLSDEEPKCSNCGSVKVFSLPSVTSG